ncbi:MAG TPA: hypothetical protein PK637_12165 [Flavobacteriales bacterium]|nr:hypothetical protein [Flavobacteriales bacterium]HRE97517.1 hypothetical protein [Flavobacteriales bacterium]HRJ37957.1 hypothetical protein [Flavobacteriales bacterium]
MKIRALLLNAALMSILVFTSVTGSTQTHIASIQCANQYSETSQGSDSTVAPMQVHTGFAIGIQFVNEVDSTLTSIEIKIGNSPGNDANLSQTFPVNHTAITWLSTELAIVTIPQLFVNPGLFIQVKVIYTSGDSNILIKQI